jgi:hypothetical protein
MEISTVSKVNTDKYVNYTTSCFHSITLNLYITSTFTGYLRGLVTRILICKIKIEIMGNLLYIIAVVLIIIWAVGFLGYNSGGIIHILLVIAVIAVVFRLVSGQRSI